MTVEEIKEYVKSEKTRLYNQVEDSTDLMDDLDDYDELLKDILSMLDELEPKEEWTDIEKSLECLRVEMLNLPTDFDKTVADDHLESLRYIFITQFKENNK